jgi:hypothetical protein
LSRTRKRNFSKREMSSVIVRAGLLVMGRDGRQLEGKGRIFDDRKGKRKGR